MSERDHSLTLKMADGRKVEMTPANSMLYTFLGRTSIGGLTIENASVNHVFITTGRVEQGNASGAYVFEEFDPVYQVLKEHIVENNYPMVLNQRTLPACDVKAWHSRVDTETAKFSAALECAQPQDF